MAQSVDKLAVARLAGVHDAVLEMGHVYLNFPGFGEEKEAMLRATYGPNYEGLVEAKICYDPGNLFHMNQNIRPTKRV